MKFLMQENTSTDVLFHVSNLVCPYSVFGYPYVAICKGFSKAIFIGKDHIVLDEVDASELEDLAADYSPSGKQIKFDLFFLKDLIDSLVKTDDYGISVYDWPEKKLCYPITIV